MCDDDEEEDDDDDEDNGDDDDNNDDGDEEGVEEEREEEKNNNNNHYHHYIIQKYSNTRATTTYMTTAATTTGCQADRARRQLHDQVSVASTFPPDTTAPHQIPLTDCVKASQRELTASHPLGDSATRKWISGVPLLEDFP